MDAPKNSVTVKGTMDGKLLAPYLRERLKRDVVVVPTTKNEDSGKGCGDDEKRKKKAEGGDKAEKDWEVKKEVEVAGQKTEYSMYCYGGHEYNGGYGHGHLFVPYAAYAYQGG